MEAECTGWLKGYIKARAEITKCFKMNSSRAEDLKQLEHFILEILC